MLICGLPSIIYNTIFGPWHYTDLKLKIAFDVKFIILCISRFRMQIGQQTIKTCRFQTFCQIFGIMSSISQNLNKLIETSEEHLNVSKKTTIFSYQ